MRPPAVERPVRLLGQDESRFGWWPIQRRRITMTGVKPVGAVPYGFENVYVYGAVEPTTGESFVLELPYLNSMHFQMFLNAFSPRDQETLNLVLMDHGSGHTANSLVIPDKVVCVCLPPYRPELNPSERLGQDVSAQLAWVVAAALAELAHRGEMIITQ